MLIGLTGKAYSGKDTFALSVVSENTDVVTAALADWIKFAAQNMFGFSYAQVGTSLKDSVDEYWDLTPREVLQDLGLWAREKYGDDIWIRRLQLKADLHAYMYNTIVTDIRFDNEADWIRGKGGKIIHIERNCIFKVKDHVTEQGIAFKDGDTLLINNSTKKEFESKALVIYKELTVKSP